jgi:(2R)-sulfolactate sulfo-lyase subunit beta
MDLSKASFWGYKRENQRVGVRNHVLILPVDDLSNAAAQAVEHNVKGAMAIPHPYGRLQFGAVHQQPARRRAVSLRGGQRLRNC